MKLNIQQSILKEHLSMATAFTGDLIPINKYILLEATGNELKIAVSSQKGSFVATIRADVIDQGSVALPARLLTDLVSTLKDDKILLSLNTSDKMTVKQGRKRPTVKGMDTEEFPVLPEIPEQEPIQFNTQVFQSLLRQTMYSLAEDESRPILQGLNLRLDDNLTLLAADGFRSSIISRNGVEGQSNIVIPRFILEQLLKLDKPVLNLYPQEKSMIIEADNILLSSPLLQGQYPDLSSFSKILKQQKTSIIINRQEFLSDLKSALLFAKEVSNRVQLVFSESDTVEIRTPESQSGYHENILDCKVTGPIQDVVVNCRYVIDVLNAIETEFVKLYLIDDNYPLFIRDDNEDLLSIIMLMGEKK